MRQMSYTVKTDRYVISGPKEDVDCSPIADEEFLTLSLTPTKRDSRRTHSTWDRVLKYADMYMDIENEDDQEFADHYPEILRGEYAGWKLNHITVTDCDLDFWYDKPETHGIGLLGLAVPDGAPLYLTVTAPMSFLGITPTYQIALSKENVTITENVGYMRREVEFLQHVDGQLPYETRYILRITEYDGI